VTSIRNRIFHLDSPGQSMSGNISYFYCFVYSVYIFVSFCESDSQQHQIHSVWILWSKIRHRTFPDPIYNMYLTKETVLDVWIPGPLQERTGEQAVWDRETTINVQQRRSSIVVLRPLVLSCSNCGNVSTPLR
jgi:hypothetical protein